MTAEAKKIAELFRRAKDYSNIVVKNFNYKSQLSVGYKGWVDHVLIGIGTAVFVEVKIGDDKLSLDQVKTGYRLSSLSGRNNRIYYVIVTNEDEARVVVDYLIGAGSVLDGFAKMRELEEKTMARLEREIERYGKEQV